jgi:hypothetical protein
VEKFLRQQGYSSGPKSALRTWHRDGLLALPVLAAFARSQALIDNAIRHVLFSVSRHNAPPSTF